MGIREFYRTAKGRINAYFSRKEQSLEEKRDLYEEEPLRLKSRSFASRVFGEIGKFFGKLAYYASVATIIPAAISFYRTTSEKPVWPYRENDQYAYILKEHFDGTIGGVIGPKETGVFNTLIERDARRRDSTGKDLSNIVDAGVQESSCKFRIRTKEGYQGEMKVQFLYQVTDEEGAKDWFFRQGTEKSKLDEIIRGALTTVIGRVRGHGVAEREEIEYPGEIKIKGKADYMKVSEALANYKLRREKFGIRVTNFVSESITMDPISAEILLSKARAEEEAAARDREAESEARQSQTQFETMKRQTKDFYDLGMILSGGDSVRAGQYADRLSERHANRLMVNEGARPIIVPGGGLQSGQPNIYINTGDIEKPAPAKNVDRS